MKRILLLKNTIQEYSWGSKTFIPELMGRSSPSEKPEAELWMGAHPSGVSRVRIDGKELSLRDLIQKEPEEILGKGVAKLFSNRLPFLFKVLAAAEPLSIQAHPNKAQAKAGFSRENSLNIPMDAPNRNYKDQNHKPELICALTSLSVLKGFRRIQDIIKQLSVVLDPISGTELDKLRNQPDSTGLKKFFQYLITRDKARQGDIIENFMEKAEDSLSSDPVYPFLDRLYRKYPCDIGVLFPLMLNYIRLKPGEALYVPPGELHAYLEGAGIEIMADSDNVLRGGLTGKHVDVKELLNILDFNPSRNEILKPERSMDGSDVYPLIAEEFRLSRIILHKDQVYRGQRERSVEIMICINGKGSIKDMEEKESLEISGGASVIIPADVGEYVLDGEVTVYKAWVPL